MDQFLDYLRVFIPQWGNLAFILPSVGSVIQLHFPQQAGLVGKLSSPFSLGKPTGIAFFMILVFCSGFLAWKGEYEAKIAAEKENLQSQQIDPKLLSKLEEKAKDTCPMKNGIDVLYYDTSNAAERNATAIAGVLGEYGAGCRAYPKEVIEGPSDLFNVDTNGVFVVVPDLNNIHSDARLAEVILKKSGLMKQDVQIQRYTGINGYVGPFAIGVGNNVP